MKLLEYLRTRHPTVNALTKVEADIIGIDYPLMSGWVKIYGRIEVSENMVEALKKARNERYASESYKASKIKSVQNGKNKKSGKQ